MGFPPNFPSTLPSSYVLWLAIGLIAFIWSIYSIAMIEYRSRIFPLTKLSITWIVSITIGFASFSILYLSDYVTKQLGIGFYSLIPLLISCLASFISGRKLDNKNREKKLPDPTRNEKF
jgi:hypothetical protein